MKIVIINTHSILNSGDAGIVLAQIQFLKKINPQSEISLTSRTPELDMVLYQPLGITISPPIIPAPSMYDNPGLKIWKSVKNLLAFRQKLRLIKKIKECDLVICSGGGYFYSNRRFLPGPMFFQNYLHLKLAVNLKKPIILFPQSFGPFYNRAAAFFLRRVLTSNTIKKIFTREEKSLELLHKLLKKKDKKVEICPDMVFYLSGKEYLQGNSHNLHLPHPIIGITVRQWDFPESNLKKDKQTRKLAFLNAFIKVAEKIYFNLGGSIVIFPQVRGPGKFENDRNISKQLFSSLEIKIPPSHLRFLDIIDTSSPLQILKIVSQIDLIIATRFHSALFAMICGVPAITISYQPKTRGIMNLLGLKEFCLEISQLHPENIFLLVQDILKNHSEIQRQLKDKIKDLKNKLEKKLTNAIHQINI